MYDLHAIHGQLRDPKSPLFRTEREMVRRLYDKLERLQDKKDPLFSMWQDELEFTYGNLDERLSQNSKIDPGELCGPYGLENAEEADLSRLLKSIQTFYSVLIKLIAYNMVHGAAPGEGDGGSPERLRQILSGKAFVRSGISNYCYDDWFSWLLKYWDGETEQCCRGLWACLERENTIGSVTDFVRSFRPDSLKHIYETVVPGQLRHALGEYYTPDWLAEYTIDSALRASGKRAAELRFMDPTCGAGTFLTGAVGMIRAGSGEEAADPPAVAGFDINGLAVLTAKANYLAAAMGRGGIRPGFVIPIYHYDVINAPVLRNGGLMIDTNCGPVCTIPSCIYERAAGHELPFSADGLLELISRREDCRGLYDSIAPYDPVDRRIIANILLNRMFAFFEEKADIVVGNPPWVNWEYLPQKYRARSRRLWREYGLLHARGRELSFAKEDISVLITYIAIDRFLAEKGYLSFVLRQAMFKSAQNGAGFRHFRLEKENVGFRVLQVDDLCRIKPFEGAAGRSALVLIRKNEEHTFPVPYNCWAAGKRFLKAAREPGATADSVMAHVRVEKMIAFPADRSDPASIWINTPEKLASAMDSVLGSNPYKARTGVFTGGANGVFWLNIEGTAGEKIRVRNRGERAKRKVREVTAEIEPDFVYPLVQGSDVSPWTVNTRAYILCPHTAETKMYPVPEDALAAAAPGTLDYLSGFRDDLKGRKGFAGWEKEIQRQHFYAVLRIGEYTFSKYKVAWRYIGRSFITAVIAPGRDEFLGEKMYIPNEKIMYVGTDCESEAYYLCGVLSSSPVSCCVKCYMNPTSISAHVLDKLNIPKYDPGDALHRRTAAICKAGHRTQDPGERERLRAELDVAVGELYGIPHESITAIRDALNGL